MYQEISKLKEEELELSKFNANQQDKIDQYRELEEDNQKRDQDLRRAIKEEKQQHRELSRVRRADSKEDAKVFQKFVTAHDERILLRQ